MAKKKEAEKENGERWMLTYLDMITLLFVYIRRFVCNEQCRQGKI